MRKSVKFHNALYIVSKSLLKRKRINSCGKITDFLVKLMNSTTGSFLLFNITDMKDGNREEKREKK